MCVAEKTQFTLTRRFVPPSPTRRGRTISGGVAQTDVACHAVATVSETSVGSLEVSALMCGSLPRPRGEGGSPDGGPGEGQPTGIGPQNVQTLVPYTGGYSGGLSGTGGTPEG